MYVADRGAKVELPLGDLGPVEYDATTNALKFQLGDTGSVIDALASAAKELRSQWAPTVGTEPVQAGKRER